MSATVHILPTRTLTPCRRCGGLRRVTFDQLDAAHQARAPLAAIHPCPDCGDRTAAIEPLLAASRCGRKGGACECQQARECFYRRQQGKG